MKAFMRMCWIVACLGMLAGCGDPESGAEPSGTSPAFVVDGREVPPPPAPPVAKLTLVPSQVELGETVTIRITGHKGSSFSALSTVSITPASPAIEIKSVQLVSASELRATVTLHDFGAPGEKTLTVTRCTPFGGTCASTFTVRTDPTPPSVTTNPPWIHQGETAGRTFIGRNTHFDLVNTTIISGTHGLSYQVTGLLRGQQLKVQVTASPTVPLGMHTFTITTLGENVTGTIEVIPPAVLTQVTPDVIVQDEPTVVEVTGENTHFTAGNTTVGVSGGDVTVTDLAVVSATTVETQSGLTG